jgi:hypothetical protein
LLASSLFLLAGGSVNFVFVSVFCSIRIHGSLY